MRRRPEQVAWLRSFGTRMVSSLRGPDAEEFIDLDSWIFENAGDPDLLVVSWAPDGTYRWSRQFSPMDPSELFDSFPSRYRFVAAPEPTGGIIIAGDLDSFTVNFGAGTHTFGGADIFLLSLDASGNTRWSKTFTAGVRTAGGGLPGGVAVDGSGNIYLGVQNLFEDDFPAMTFQPHLPSTGYLGNDERRIYMGFRIEF